MGGEECTCANTRHVSPVNMSLNPHNPGASTAVPGNGSRVQCNCAVMGPRVLCTRHVCDVAVNGKLMETLDENSGNESHKMFVTFSFLIEHIY